MWGMNEGMGWWMVVGSVWFVLFWGLIVWVVVSLTTRKGVVSAAGPPAALEIAKARYARGEIGREEFERLKTDLS